ncbi:MAG: benzoate-CoA ligase family protein [Pyrinomonadaceae bacterium]|nr:benzoate-CoA ligase family protein [Pyrinomonadaceae bacterium]
MLSPAIAGCEQMNLFDAIFSNNSPAKLAVLYEQQEIAYGDLREQTLRLSRILALLGITPGDRVALLLSDSPEFIASFIAIASSGAIAVPINMGLRLDEQQLILNDCGASVALVESGLSDTLLRNPQERLPSLKEVIVVCRSDDNPSISQREGPPSGHESGPRIQTLPELLSETEGQPEPKFPPAGEETPAFILYTSGSTGEPKGAVHSQAHIYYTNDTFCREVLKPKPNDRIFSSSRLPFAYGLGNSLSFPLLNGATTILCRHKPSPEVISRIFVDYKPTVFFGVPVIYNLLLEHRRRGHPLDCSSLRICISAGEALPAPLGEEWEKTFGVQVLDGIGSTEMLHMFISNHEGEVRYGSSGKLLEGYAARLLDEHENPTPPGAEGNLWVKGESAALGYWQKPEVTARTFVEGWVRTGDLYFSDDGYWFHRGRSDDCFKSSGQWVSPVEVEGALLLHKRISRAAVVEDFDKDGLPCACAFVICKQAEPELDRLEAELREFLRHSLPRFKQPRRYVFVSELPYTATGKVQRFKLRERLRSSESNP